MQALSDEVLHRFRTCKVLIVDDEHYTRKVIRALLMAIGITHIDDAPDGESGLEAIATFVPTSSSSTGKCPASTAPVSSNACAVR